MRALSVISLELFRGLFRNGTMNVGRDPVGFSINNQNLTINNSSNFPTSGKACQKWGTRKSVDEFI